MSDSVLDQLKRQHEDEDDGETATDNCEYANKNNKSKKSKKPKKESKVSFQENLLALQREQLQRLEETEKRNQEFMVRLMENQRTGESEEREKDRQFFLELGRMFMQN